MTAATDRIAKIRAQATKSLERAKKMTDEAKALERSVQSKAQADERKKDTRRKILIGSMNIDRAAAYDDHRIRQLDKLNVYLTRDSDRALFDLKPLNLNLKVEAKND